MKLIVKGAVQEVEDRETFTGTATSSQVFTLSKKPISVQVWEDSDDPANGNHS